MLLEPHRVPDPPEVVSAHIYAYTRQHMSRQPEIYVNELGWTANRRYRRVMGDVIATKIRKLRISLGLNQSELAKRLNVTQASVSRWEKGSLPDADKLSQLAELSGETVRSFIGV